ncbi:MAG: MaoC/PaaZ C-terminal domain-containing protein [Candidatus Bathyarchaeota archaeon]|nr:MaoC/PaaZ C-terminal domain-containing protein [Candidatus Bathyarchaeota archaeon]
MKGKYFEDLKIGEHFETPGRTVTEADIVNFAGISGDYNPLHIDEEFAKKTRFGARIAHGVLTLSIMTGLWARLGILEGTVEAFYGIERLRFTKPVYSGETLHVKMKVVDNEEKGQSGIVVLENTVLNQKSETVMVCTTNLLVKKRPK